MKLLILCMVLVIASCSWKDYSTLEKSLAVCGVVAGAADMITTDKILDQGGYEMNPILGSNPNDEVLYMAYFTSMLIKIGMAELWEDNRTWIWGSSCVVGSAMSFHNYGEIE